MSDSCSHSTNVPSDAFGHNIQFGAGGIVDPLVESLLVIAAYSRKPETRFAADRKADSQMTFTKLYGAPCLRPDNVGESFREDPLQAMHFATTKPPCLQPDFNNAAMPEQVGKPARNAAISGVTNPHPWSTESNIPRVTKTHPRSGECRLHSMEWGSNRNLKLQGIGLP